MSPRPGALVVAAALVTGCAVGGQPAGPPTEDHDAVRGARAALGEPMVGLARSLLRAADRLDGARHQLPRGQAMRDALAAASSDAAALRAAADAAAQAAGVVADDPTAVSLPAVAEAAGLVADAAAGAREAADATAAEAAFLARLADADAAMDAVVARWDTPGSQSQLRALLAGLGADMEALAAQLAGVAPLPAPCPRLRDNRLRWAALLAARSRELAARATSAGGSAYDELRAEFRRQPYGEDRLAADAADRACWQEHSRLARTADAAPGLVEELERLLEP